MRLFGGYDRPVTPDRRHSLFLPWVAPTTGCAFLLALALVQTPPPLGYPYADAVDRESFIHTPAFAALQTAPSHSAANNLVATSFAWTNRALPPSTNASFRGEAVPF